MRNSLWSVLVKRERRATEKKISHTTKIERFQLKWSTDNRKRIDMKQKNIYIHFERSCHVYYMHLLPVCLPFLFSLPVHDAPIMWPNFFMANWHYDDDDCYCYLLLLLSFSIATDADGATGADAGDIIRFISYWTSSTHLLYFHLHSNRFHR